MGWTRTQVLNVARRTGYPVVEAWSGHNQGLMGTVYGPMLHHTATPTSAFGDYPSLRIVRDGRSDLPNSLSMYGLGRSGTIYCISEKVSWHAGPGSWNGITDGNGHFAGIEAESSGNGSDWTSAQLDSYKKLCASILMETGRGVEWMVAHKEWAQPAGRKIDPAGIDMARFRSDVRAILLNPSLLGREEEDLKDDERRALFAIHDALHGGANLRLPNAIDDIKNRVISLPRNVAEHPIPDPDQDARLGKTGSTAPKWLIEREGARAALRTEKQVAALQGTITTLAQLLADKNDLDVDEIVNRVGEVVEEKLAAGAVRVNVEFAENLTSNQ